MTMRKMARLGCGILVLALVQSGLYGCAPNDKKTSAESNSSAEIKFPLKENLKLKYWKMQDQIFATVKSDEAQAEFFQEMEKRTGITIEFVCPPQGQENDQFNIMVASNDLPDFIEGGWSAFSGGIARAYDDDLIIGLNDYLEKYAPNYKELLDKNPELNKNAKTDNGKYLLFPFVRLDKGLRTFAGPIVRKDWLDELHLEMPTTIDEWYTVLKAFKDQKNAKAPLTFMDWQISLYPAFISAFNIYPKDYYLENGQMKYYAVEKGYKQFLETLRKWYEEGLLDPEFATLTNSTLDAKITSGKTGAFIGSAGSGVGKYIKLMKEKDPKFDIVGAPYPTLKKGELPKFSHMEQMIDEGGSVSITTANKHPKESIAWVDYAYGKEGHMLNNFGIEGVSYKMEEDYPKFTDTIMKSQEYSVAQMMSRYIRGSKKGAFVQDPRFYEQYMEYPQQTVSLENWRKAENKDILPPLTATSEEVAKIASKQTEIDTYKKEMFFKFIMGQESLDKFDDYVNKINSMGLDEIIKIKEEQLKRYNNR